MANEFMKFLIRDEELNAMALQKRLVTVTKELSSDPMFAAFGQIPEERAYYPEGMGVNTALVKQIRTAAFKVGRGELTIDNAIALFGQF